jgi:hypothetical protein
VWVDDRQGTAEVASEAEVTIERALKEYARIAVVDIHASHDDNGNLLPMPQMPQDIRRALTGVEITELYGEGEQIGQPRKFASCRKSRRWIRWRSIWECSLPAPQVPAAEFR